MLPHEINDLLWFLLLSMNEHHLQSVYTGSRHASGEGERGRQRRKPGRKRTEDLRPCTNAWDANWTGRRPSGAGP